MRLSASFALSYTRSALMSTLLGLVLLLGALVGATAEDNGKLTSADLDTMKKALETTIQAIKDPNISESALDKARAATEDLRLKALTFSTNIAPDVKAADDRLTQLKPKTDADKEVETPELKAEREAQAKVLGELQTLQKKAQVLEVQAGQVIGTIAELRHQRFTRKLFEANHSLLDPALWRDVSRALPSAVNSLGQLINDWATQLNSRVDESPIGAILIAIIFALMLIAPGRYMLLRITRRDATPESLSILAKLTAAVWVTSVYAIVPVLGMKIIHWTMTTFALSNYRIDKIVTALITIVAIISISRGLVRALLAPMRPAWRLVPITDMASNRISFLLLIATLVFAFANFADDLGNILHVPLSLIVAITGFLTIVTALLLLASLRTLTRGLRNARLDEEAAAPASAAQAPKGSIWRWALPLAWGASFVTIIAALIGYIAFGWFLLGQLIWTGALLAALYLLLNLTETLFLKAFHKDSALGRSLFENVGVTGNRIEQIGAILSGLIRLLLIALAAILILSPWGLDANNALGSAKALFFGVKIGGLTISISAILLAISIFTVATLATRGIQNWVEHRFLPHTALDIGIRNSIRTGLGYIGIIIAAAVALSYLGLNLENIAIVAGALSVGIGFGLQSVVNNFVSGLILLWERPIKTGDWIVAGGEQGYVRRINVRSTEIETFDRATVVVPNSNLISDVVKNWMHRDMIGRVIVPIGVSYDSDPDQVKSILLEVARGHSMIVGYPAPNVYFTGFGDSSLDFQLRCYLSNVDYMLSVTSDLRFEIMRRFREANIEIPFPQRDINLRDMDKLETMVENIIVEKAQNAMK